MSLKPSILARAIFFGALFFPLVVFALSNPIFTPFGGQVLSIIPCTPTPAIPVSWEVNFLDSKTPYMYILFPPKLTETYLNGPPFLPGQYVIGKATPPLPLCIVGGAPVKVKQIRMVGTSLLPHPAQSEPTPPASENICLANKFDPSTSVGKALREAAIRKQLLSQNIRVNKTFCPSGADFHAVTGGCTDVSGLKCSALLGLQNLSAKCGGFLLTGGSEAGHSSHLGGDAVDIESGPTFTEGISACIEKKFDPRGKKGLGNLYADKDGTTFWQEYPGQSLHGDGESHWHICFGGVGC